MKTRFYAIVLIISVIASLFVYIYNSERVRVESHFFEYGENILNTYAPLISGCIATGDDLNLISHSHNICLLKNVVHFMVISPDNTVLVHNRASEIGRKYADSVTNSILKITKPEKFTNFIDNQKVYEFCFPVYSGTKKNGIIRLGLAYKEVNRELQQFAEFLAVSGILLILAVIIIIFITTNAVVSPVNKINGIINGIVSGGIEKFDNGLSIKNISGKELVLLTELINKLVQSMKTRYIEQQDNLVSQKNDHNLYLARLSEFIKKGIILTDNQNRIIYLNEKGTDLLQVTGKKPTGEHILELVSNIELKGLIKQSNDNKNVLMSSTINNMKINMVTVKNSKNELVGTVISAE